LNLRYSIDKLIFIILIDLLNWWSFIVCFWITKLYLILGMILIWYGMFLIWKDRIIIFFMAWNLTLKLNLDIFLFKDSLRIKLVWIDCVDQRHLIVDRLMMMFYLKPKMCCERRLVFERLTPFEYILLKINGNSDWNGSDCIDVHWSKTKFGYFSF